MKRTVLIVLALFVAIAITGCGGEDGDTTSFGADNAPAPADGVVQVALVWDEEVDLDLEIWDATGTNALTSAGLLTNDVMTKADGAEYVDFITYDDVDLSTGEFVVSVYFAEETEVVSEATAKLIVTDADGSEKTYEGTVKWEEGTDQWHAFKIDAETGDFDEIDEYIMIEITE